MGITISGANGIDMGDKPISNVSIVNSVDVVDKAYVDDLKIIATGTATFTATTNNINLTGIGIGVEVGDVIQISGADDSKNNSEFTVEVITDANNIIVNQAHANKGTTKNVAQQAGDAGVTVKLLAKWYSADIGLGQGWVDVSSNRSMTTNYTGTPNRSIFVSIAGANTDINDISLVVDGITIASVYTGTATGSFLKTISSVIPKSINYRCTTPSSGIFSTWCELR